MTDDRAEKMDALMAKVHEHIAWDMFNGHEEFAEGLAAVKEAVHAAAFDLVDAWLARVYAIGDVVRVQTDLDDLRRDMVK